MYFKDRKDLLLYAKYMEVITDILSIQENISLTKTIVLAFIYVNNSFSDIFVSRDKKYVFDKYLPLLTEQKELFFESIELEFDCINILKESGILFQKGLFISLKGKKNNLNKTIEKLVLSLNDYSEQQFIREVLCYV